MPSLDVLSHVDDAVLVVSFLYLAVAYVCLMIAVLTTTENYLFLMDLTAR